MNFQNKIKKITKIATLFLLSVVFFILYLPRVVNAVATLAPTGLVAKAASSTQINLTWNTVSGATGYKIYRNGTFIKQVITNNASDTGLTAMTVYNYAVTSIDNLNNESAKSEVVNAKTLPTTNSAKLFITGDYELTGDINCQGMQYCLVIAADNVVIRGNGYRILGTKYLGSIFSGGIYNYGFDNIFIDNVIIDGFKNSINFENADNIKISNSRTLNSLNGVLLKNSINSEISNNNFSNYLDTALKLFNLTNINIKNNEISQSGTGLYIAIHTGTSIVGNNFHENKVAIGFADTKNSVIQNNIFSNNQYVSWPESSEMSDLSSNQMLHENNLFSLKVNGGSVKNRGDNISFIIQTSELPSGSASTYSITTMPQEQINVTRSGDTITGNFIANQEGMYSIIVESKDLKNNVRRQRFPLIVGETNSRSVTYYLRDIYPIHGQPANIVPQSDMKSANLSLPTSEESINCSIWIQAAIDEIPQHPYALISDIQLHSVYQLGTNPNYPRYIGLDPEAGWGQYVDPALQQDIPPAGTYSQYDNYFNGLDWMIAYPRDWYWLSFKLAGDRPSWQSTPINPSYAKINMKYPIKPEVLSNSDEGVVLLSATQNSNRTTLTLENPNTTARTTTVTLATYRSPFTDAVSRINPDGTTAVTINSIEAMAKKSLNSVPLEITAAQKVDINSISWNALLMQWTQKTASSSVNYIVKELIPNVRYNITYQSGTSFALENPLTTLITNTQGLLTFTAKDLGNDIILRIRPISTPTITYGILDFKNLVANWLKTGTSLLGDVNGNGIVNVQDIGIMMSKWKP